MKTFEPCKDCDGSCIGSHACAQSFILGTERSEYYYVCRACNKTGCIMNKEEFDNLSVECVHSRDEAEKSIIEFEKLMFGDS